MKTVYAFTYDANKLSGKSGKNRAVGFTFDAHPESFGDLIAAWESNEFNEKILWSCLELLFKQIEENFPSQQQQYDNNILQVK
ncbi:unnamed protein product [Adineta steineri]|uniref:Uncharacterized protein n=1 Tax=Adineta steineri TaxID=433720 RepID=A0A819UZ46_9BILA|nr:unnamed protein product [Adineta steineri]CAF4103599.1 unnamed protein product [Adineta steineri]